MGQQQLLLLVLGAIIVGVAVVVGINMFSGGALQANEDAVRQDCLTIASRCTEWFRKPLVLGGGGRDFTNVPSWSDIGYTEGVNGLIYTNQNGSYSFSITGQVLTIIGTLGEDTTKTVSYTLTNAGGKLTLAKLT